MHDHSNMDHSQMDHSHNTESEPSLKEYIKFAGVIVGIVIISYYISLNWEGFSISNYLRIFMGVFFAVFGIFKILDLKGFAMSYMGYDIIAKRFTGYAYIYPFIELALAAGYFLKVPYTDWVTLIIMTIGSVGVFKELKRGSKIKCACLGTYIKLPLTTVSLTEDIAMGVMALLMILKLI